MADRSYDIVLYGASGFTGKQTVQYFAQYVASGEVRIAIAGRNREKLESVKAQVSVNVDVLVADSLDPPAIDAIVSQTRVLLNTAGPFALYGNAIVDACVRLGSHYVDITGETPWVKDLCDRYHNKAASNGTRIIPLCGFDSIPSDLGTYLVVRHIQQELGVSCLAVKAYFQANGGFNGGTLASAFNLFDDSRAEQVSNPFLLNPSNAHSPMEMERNQDPKFPQYDADIGTWVAPFFVTTLTAKSNDCGGSFQYSRIGVDVS